MNRNEYLEEIETKANCIKRALDDALDNAAEYYDAPIKSNMLLGENPSKKVRYARLLEDCEKVENLLAMLETFVKMHGGNFN